MRKKSSSKTNFLAQGTILVIASFVAKAIGMIYRIPLTHILGDDGNGYYSTANEIYTIILMISSFSLPLAVSRLVAEREYAGEVKNSYKVLICSLRFAAVTGGILSILTFLLGGVITKYVMGVELASYALRVLAPAEGELSIVAKFQKEALCELLHRLLQRAEKLAVSKIARRSTLFKSACDKRFRHLIERVHFEMHQLVHDDLFQILLLRIDRVQQENGLFILAVHFEIAGLAPGRVLHKFQLHVPRRNDPQLFAEFIKNLCQLGFVHRMILLITINRNDCVILLRPIPLLYQDRGSV